MIEKIIFCSFVLFPSPTVLLYELEQHEDFIGYFSLLQPQNFDNMVVVENRIMVVVMLPSDTADKIDPNLVTDALTTVIQSERLNRDQQSKKDDFSDFSAN